MGFGGALTGAGTGAALGSFLPGIGTGVGAGIGGLIGLFKGGGNDRKKEDEENGTLDPLTQLLQKSANDKQQQGQEFSAMGKDAIGPVLDYFGKILSGNPQALLDATKAQRGRVIDQYDAARNAIGNFSPRGGGATAAMGETRIAEANALSDITSDAQNNAAAALSALGPQLAGLGLSAEQLASADLGTVIQAVLAQKGLDLNKRGQNLEAISGVGDALGTLLGLYLTRGGGGK